jgi:hypothetical protein
MDHTQKSTRKHRLNGAHLDGVDLSPNQVIQSEKVRVGRYLGNYLLLWPIMAQQSSVANYEYHHQYHASAAAHCVLPVRPSPPIAFPVRPRDLGRVGPSAFTALEAFGEQSPTQSLGGSYICLSKQDSKSARKFTECERNASKVAIRVGIRSSVVGGDPQNTFTAFRPFLGPCCVRGASAQLGGPKVRRVCRAVPT